MTSGATVLGIFADGTDSQIPIIIGSFPKIEYLSQNQVKKRVDDTTEKVKQIGTHEEFEYILSWEELFLELKNSNRNIDSVIVHWTDSHTNKDLDAKEIDYIAKKNGFDKGIGYHYIIRRDGSLQKGRPLNEVGEHASGYDQTSIGIAFVGGINAPIGTPNPKRFVGVASINRTQFNTFDTFLSAFFKVFPDGTAVGHNDISENIDPGFNVPQYCKSIFRRL